MKDFYNNSYSNWTKKKEDYYKRWQAQDKLAEEKDFWTKYGVTTTAIADMYGEQSKAVGGSPLSNIDLWF